MCAANGPVQFEGKRCFTEDEGRPFEVWKPKEALDSGLRKTVYWYLENRSWIKKLTSGQCKSWMKNSIMVIADFTGRALS